MSDAFKTYLAGQLKQQQETYSRDPLEMTGEERVEYIRWNALAAVREVTEMLDKVRAWKPWANDRREAGEFKDRAEFVEEGVDALKFIGNLLLTAGVTDEELSEVWDAKGTILQAREDRGYAGDGAEFDAEHPDIRARITEDDGWRRLGDHVGPGYEIGPPQKHLKAVPTPEGAEWLRRSHS